MELLLIIGGSVILLVIIGVLIYMNLTTILFGFIIVILICSSVGGLLYLYFKNGKSADVLEDTLADMTNKINATLDYEYNIEKQQQNNMKNLENNDIFLNNKIKELEKKIIDLSTNPTFVNGTQFSSLGTNTIKGNTTIDGTLSVKTRQCTEQVPKSGNSSNWNIVCANDEVLQGMKAVTDTNGTTKYSGVCCKLFST
jgi:hypothetical protein